MRPVVQAIHKGFEDTLAVSSFYIEAVSAVSNTTTMRIYGSGSVVVNWGGGKTTTHNISSGGTNVSSSVSNGQTIIVHSKSTVNRIQFTTNTLSSIDMKKHDDLTSMVTICVSLSNLTSFASSGNMTGVTNADSAWSGCFTLASFSILTMSNVTIFDQAWKDTAFTTFPLIDISSATSLWRTWSGCLTLTTFPLLDTTNVTNFEQAWFNDLDLLAMPAIDTSAGTNFRSTFDGCDSLVCLSQINTLNSGGNTLNMFASTGSLTNPTASEQTSIETGLNYTNSNACP